MVAMFMASASLLCACYEETDPADNGSDGGETPGGDEPATCLHTAAAIDGPGTYAYTAWSPIDDYVLAGTDQDVRLLRADTALDELVLADSIMVRPRSNATSSDGPPMASTRSAPVWRCSYSRSRATRPS